MIKGELYSALAPTQILGSKNIDGHYASLEIHLSGLRPVQHELCRRS